MQVVGVAVALLVLGGAAWAAETESAEEAAKAAAAFEELYGADVKRVRATRDAKDDLELAVRLLDAAKSMANQPAMLTVLCEKAYELASAAPDGYATAIEAMELEAAKVPAKAAACGDKALALRQKRFDAAKGDEKAKAGDDLIDAITRVVDAKVTAGAPAEALETCKRALAVAYVTGSPRKDELELRVKALAEVIKAAREAEPLKRQLQADPQNAVMREKLVRLCLVEMDNPAEAAKFVEGVKDAGLAKFVPAAAKPVQDAPDLACLDLGAWYGELAGAAAPACKAAMLMRARAYLRRFVELHTADDLDRAKGALALKKVGEELDRLGANPAGKPLAGIDVLRLADPAADVARGVWQRQPEGLVCTTSTAQPIGLMTLPYLPGTNYELQGTFLRTSGEGTVAFILPVGPSRIMLDISTADGKASGLQMINGKRILESGIGVTGGIENNRDYVVGVKVAVKGNQANIVVTLDGKTIVNWQGPTTALTVPDDCQRVAKGCLGIGAWAPVVFKSVKLKPLSNDSRPARPGK